MKKNAFLVSLTLCSVYIGSYCLVRQLGWIIHRSGYRTQSGMLVIDNHSVSQGEIGVMGRGIHKSFAHLFSTPLRYLEVVCWNFVCPVGSQWVAQLFAQPDVTLPAFGRQTG